MRFDIIIIFNKFRINFDNENFTIFIILFNVYKYRMLLFNFINNFTIY